MKLICGIDECGRGPLAGPVTAAACAYITSLPYPFVFPSELADSKQLTEKKRHVLEEQLRNSNGVFFALGWVFPDTIDRINIHHASLLAMKKAYMQLTSILPPQHCITEILIDGKFLPELPVPGKAVIKGDSFIPCIQAASIIAKNSRDALMQQYDKEFPLYCFAQHKGYPTKLHTSRIKEFGICAIHRKSFCKKYKTKHAPVDSEHSVEHVQKFQQIDQYLP